MRNQLVLLVCVLAAGAPAHANPYGVTGADWRSGGHMVALDMPRDCSGIHWGSLSEHTVPQMPRPCKPDAPRCAYSSYHPDTETIEDATRFAQWVRDQPGRIWVLGNEPDNPTQDGDGMTPESYAVMYRVYHTLIQSNDPTARIAVGALSGDAVPGDLEHDTTWWERAMAAYRERYGEPMPVDIWNYHCYAPPHLRDVEDYMSIYVDPFCEWVRTVDGGRFADCPIWCTEFGIGFWHGPLNAKWVEPWMQRVCLRLEHSDVERWFWFLGPWDRWSPGGDWQETCLLGPDNSPTVLGRRYGRLAHGYPNTEAAPLPDPKPRDPPAHFADDFEDGDVSDWIDKSGPWIADAGAYRCNWGDFVPRWWGHFALQPYVYHDFVAEADVKINSASEANYWAGLYLRAPEMFGGPAQGGYLVYLRQDGTLGLFAHGDGSLAEVPAAVNDTSNICRLEIECKGAPATIRVSIDGTPLVTWTDTEARFESGFVALASGKSDCTFDNVTIDVIPPAGGAGDPARRPARSPRR